MIHTGRKGGAAGWAARALSGVLLLSVAITPARGGVVVSSTSTALSLSPGGPFSTARDKAVGASFATSTTGVSASGFTGVCQIQATYAVNSPEVSSGVFETGVPGIAMKFYAVVGGVATRITAATPVQRTVSLSAPGALATIEAELIVSGTISSGSLTASPGLPTLTAGFAIVGTGNAPSCVNLSPSSLYLPVTASNPTVTALTCSVTNTNITVSLPTSSIRLLSRRGNTAGDTQFSIPLNCANAGANVYITLTDATTPTNTTNILTLKSTSTAHNVGLQILRNNGATPVSYGPDSALALNPNQWLVGPSSTTTEVPLIVHYIATGVATPGAVQGIATFTMSYQ